MSNPTSNFGWQMPTATDLVTDLPADFEVFGQAVDTDFVDLLGGTTGQILSKTSATDLDFTWIANDQGDITGVTAGTGISVTSPTGPVPTVAIDTAVTVDKTTAQTLTNKTLTSPALTTPTISTATTNGDILYGTGSGALARLGIGSAANVLTVSGGVPAWVAPAGGGKVLQVVMGTTGTSVTANNGTYVDTNLTATITPSSASSKVLALVAQNGCYKSSGNAANGINLRLLRAGSNIITFAYEGLATDTAIGNKGSFPVMYLDSPATTSATIYKTQFSNGGVSANLVGVNSNATSTIILIEIGA